jgi:phosphoglycerol geranylgeranyltransferase
MQDGNVYKKILMEAEQNKGNVFLVIDPPNQLPEIAGKTAKIAEKSGVSAIAVGGSVGAQGELLDKTILAIKDNCKLPVVLFPGNIATVSRHADAIYFMSLMNSLDPYYVSGAQIASAFPIKKIGIEVIPTSYIITEPGRAVGWVGRAHLIPRNLPYLAGATALAGEMMGSKLIILESGGGAESPAPPKMVSAVKKSIEIPLIVAGGVRTPKFAFETIAAGADIIHVGTAIEEAKGSTKKTEEKLIKLVQAVKKAAKTKK